MTEMRAAAPARPRLAIVLLALSIFVAAANLRPAITSVGSVIGLIGTDTGLTASQLGFLGALPLVAFAVVSPLVHVATRRLSSERTVFLALILLCAGTVIRSLPGLSANLWLGTIILGAAIAVCNVLVPTIVKRGFPNNIAFMTGAYSAVMTGSAALGSGLAVPLGERGGWQIAIGAWAALSLLSAVAWIPQWRRADSPPPREEVDPAVPTGSMWRSAIAWQVSLFMGLQSTSFYLLVTWLPTIEASYGVSAAVAGWHLFFFQVAGIVSGLGVTAFMRRRADQRAVGAFVSLMLVVAMAGLLIAPGLAIAWVLLAGLSTGSSLVVALSLVGLRARTAHDASRLSGMVQGVGYLIASLGPLGAGLLIQLTGQPSLPIGAVAVVASAQVVMALFAGRDRYTHARSGRGAVATTAKEAADLTGTAPPCA